MKHLLALSLLVAACGSPVSTSPPFGDTSPTSSTESSGSPSPSASNASDPVDASIVCNTLTTTGLASSKLRTTLDAAPASLGGALEDGTYVLVETTVYGQTPLPVENTGRAKIELTGSTAQIVSDDGRTNTETWTTSGNTLTSRQTCPSTQPAATHPFTVERSDAGTTRLLLDVSEKGLSSVRVFEKR